MQLNANQAKDSSGGDGGASESKSGSGASSSSSSSASGSTPDAKPAAELDENGACDMHDGNKVGAWARATRS